MKKFVINLVKLALCIALIFLAEKYYDELLNFIGINITSISSINKNVLNVILYIIIALCINLIYKEELKNTLNKFRRKFGSNLLKCIISFLALFLTMIVINYLLKTISSSFHLNYVQLNYLNIFNQTLDLNLIIIIVKNIILIPFIYVMIFVYGVDELFSSNKFSIICSGLLFTIYNSYGITGSVGNIIVNLIPEFVLFGILTYIYQKNNNSISFSIITYILYILFAGVLVAEVL